LYTGKSKFPADIRNGTAALIKKYNIVGSTTPQKVLSTNIGFLLQNSQHYDVIIASEDGKQFPAHKCILAARCEYFASMLSGGFTESVYDRITMNDMNGETLQAFLHFMYPLVL
jgi:hypothetical protein